MRKWRPYGNPRDPSSFVVLSNLYPMASGSYRPGPTFTAKGTAAAGPATPGTTLSAWCALKPDGTGVGYVGTTTKLYEISNLSTGSFTDRSKGGGYTNTATSWHFAQFGNISIATNLVDAVQSRDATGASAFADLAGTPPKAKIVLTQSNCVLLFNTNGGTAYQDGYAVSDVGDQTNWTTGEAVSGRILIRPGPITAAVAVRDEVIVFKKNSIFRMKYEGAPLYWSVTLLADGIGTSAPSQVVSCGDFIVFIGPSGGFVYDGATMKSIGDDFSGNGSTLFNFYATYPWQSALYFKNSGHVVFSGDGTEIAGSINKNLVYNTISDRFGSIAVGQDKGSYRALIGEEAAIIAVAGSAQFGANTSSANGENLIDLSSNPCVICDDSAPSVGWSLTSEIMGDESFATHITRAIPRWTSTGGHSYSLPSAGQFSADFGSYRDLNDTAQESKTVISSTNLHRFDVNLTGRFLKFTMSGTADMEIDDVSFITKPAGTD